MSEMVERVARAMEPRAFETLEAGYTNRNWLEERAFLNAEKVVKRIRKKARAAIEAMREPTDAMVDATEDLDVYWGYMAEGLGTPEDVWRAMIDAALKPAQPIEEA